MGKNQVSLILTGHNDVLYYVTGKMFALKLCISQLVGSQGPTLQNQQWVSLAPSQSTRKLNMKKLQTSIIPVNGTNNATSNVPIPTAIRTKANTVLLHMYLHTTAAAGHIGGYFRPFCSLTSV